MSERLDYPEGATPPDPNWTWTNAMAISDPVNRPQAPSLIEYGELRPYPGIPALAAVLAGRLQGRRPVLKATIATFDGFDSFPAWSVYAQAEGAESTAAHVYIGCAAIQKTRREVFEAAIAEAAQQLQVGRVAA